MPKPRENALASRLNGKNYPNPLTTLQCSLGTVGELSVWEFSGEPNYHFLYDHFIGNVNCIHIVCFNLVDTTSDQLKHLNYWLVTFTLANPIYMYMNIVMMNFIFRFAFLRSRIPPVEPLSAYITTLTTTMYYVVRAY